MGRRITKELDLDLGYYEARDTGMYTDGESNHVVFNYYP